MKKSDVFNRQYPRPLDRHIHHLYRTYKSSSNALITKWMDTITNGNLGDRNLPEIEECRLRLTDDGEVIVSHKLILPSHQVEKMMFFAKFFPFYKLISDDLIAMLLKGIAVKESSRLPGWEKEFTEWYENNRFFLEIAIECLKGLINNLMIPGFNSEHIKLLSETYQSGGIDSLHTLMSEQDYLSVQGKVKHSVERLLESYWTYAKKDYKRSLEAVELRLSTTLG